MKEWESLPFAMYYRTLAKAMKQLVPFPIRRALSLSDASKLLFLFMAPLTDIPARLSASKEGSWAWQTVKSRLPVILVTVINTLHQEKDQLVEKHGPEGGCQSKATIALLAKLRYEIMTDKPLTRLEDNLPDSKLWNSFLDELYKCEDSPRWFFTPWLYIECLMYRQIVSALHQSKLLSTFDPFAGGKKASWKNSEDAIHSVLGFLNKQTCSPPADIEDVKSLVRQFLELSLWGNKCDLSISSGQDNSQTSNPLKQIGQLDEFLLVDDYECLWSQLLQLREKHGGCNSVRIDIILDNAGFELLSDLCLAEVLLTVGMASQIMFHIKSYPWFVSDTTEDDVKYCLSKLQQSDMMLERCQGNAWAARVNEGSFVFRKDEYWTLPHDYAAMREKCPKLYTLLSDSDLLIFKGDLNYRKLLGDREWPCEATFDEALLAFNPAPMLSLRTLKAELCVGLEIGMMEKLTKQDKEWMVSGKYAVIQFTDTVLPLHLPSKADSSGDSRQKVAIQSTVTVIE